MKRKYLGFVLILCLSLVGCTSSNKKFERGTLNNGIYNNESFNLEFVYPDNLQQTGKESIAY